MPVAKADLDKQSFALRLAELRERAGLTQADVVRNAKGAFKQSHISAWERSVNAPNVLYIDAIAEAIGCEGWELLEDPTPGFTPTPSPYSKPSRPRRSGRG